MHEILNINTYGHCWEEFSAREIKDYFHLLSPDFRVNRLMYIDFYETFRFPKMLKDRWGILFKHNIYAEVELVTEEKGIIIHSSWTSSQTNQVLDKESHFTPPHTLSWQLEPYLEGEYKC